MNTSGEYRDSLDGAQPENFEVITSNRVEEAATERDLPDFCDVRVEQLVGGHVVHTTIWVPLAWNGRFFGLGGQGNRSSAPWIYPDDVRIASLPRVLRNGFAGAETDAGNVDPRFADWGLNVKTNEVALSVRDFSELDTSDPDLSGLRESGGKLLLSHAMDDEVIPASGTLHYYRRVLEKMGGLEATSPFARLFMSPGEGHSHVTAAGPGLTRANGMVALMNWVEKGIAPDSIRTERYELSTGERTMTRMVCAYPNVAQFRGSGDRRDAENFTCVSPEGAA